MTEGQLEQYIYHTRKAAELTWLASHADDSEEQFEDYTERAMAHYNEARLFARLGRDHGKRIERLRNLYPHRNSYRS